MYKQVRKFNTKVTDAAGMCHRFVRTGFGIPAGGPKGEAIGSAWAAWTFSKTKHKNRDFPKSVDVPLWFSHYGSYGSPKKYANWGHVVVKIANKEEYYSSPEKGTGRKVYKSIAAVEKAFNAKYVGWTEDVNGRAVIEKVPLKADQRQVKSNSALNVREAPNTKAKQTAKYKANEIVSLKGWVTGETVAKNNVWYFDGKGYSWSGGYSNPTSPSTGLPDLNPKPANLKYEKIEPKEVELIINIDKWDFNYNVGTKAKSVGKFKKGYKFTAVAIASHANKAKYYMDAHDYDGGAIQDTYGFNVVDCKDVPKPVPPPEPEPEEIPGWFKNFLDGLIEFFKNFLSRN